MRTPRPHELSPQSCRIVCFSDTYGLESKNGVGRFLHDIRTQSAHRNLPFELIVPGKGEEIPCVRRIRAPSFTLPGYADVDIAMPLEQHRKAVSRQIQNWQPDVVHVSTPGPIGIFGLSIAQQRQLPVVGIYHTDFPGFAREIVRLQLTQFQHKSSQSFGPVASWLVPLLMQRLSPFLDELDRLNPEFQADLVNFSKIAKRNFDYLAESSYFIELAARLADAITTEVMRRFYSRFSLVVARSLSQQQELQDKLGLDAASIRCLAPGTDIEKFNPVHNDRKIWKQIGVPPDAFIALYVGRITAEKNFDFLIRVWNELQASRQPSDPEMQLVVVGEGQKELKERACELPGVHLIGPQRGNQLSTIYASSDAVLFPSVTETLGQVGLEAGASGVPVVVADRGGQVMYVEEGRTGFIRSTEDVTPWVETVQQMACDESQRKEMGAAARDHIAANHTFESTLRSYWSIHEEAVEGHRRTRVARPRVRPSIRAQAATSDDLPIPGVLVITDYHAGKKFGTAKQRARKEGALEKMLQVAVDEDLEVIFGGDFADHGPRPSRLEEDFKMLRKVRQRVGLSKTPIFVRGNHDYGYSDEQLVQFTGGCHIHSSLLYVHPDSGVTMTHGHILGLNRTIELSKNTFDPERLQEALREEVLDEDLKPSVIAYGLANLIESYTEQKGLTGLGTFWEGVFETRSLVAEKLLKFGQQSSQADERTFKLIASLVGSHDDVQTAAMLGAACGGWATIVGHTHDPLTRCLRFGNRADAPVPFQVVGNAGNINRKYPTCAVVKFPEVVVHRYRQKTDTLHVLYRDCVPETEIEPTAARLRARHALPSA